MQLIISQTFCTNIYKFKSILNIHDTSHSAFRITSSAFVNAIVTYKQTRSRAREIESIQSQSWSLSRYSANEILPIPTSIINSSSAPGMEATLAKKLPTFNAAVVVLFAHVCAIAKRHDGSAVHTVTPTQFQTRISHHLDVPFLSSIHCPSPRHSTHLSIYPLLPVTSPRGFERHIFSPPRRKCTGYRGTQYLSPFTVAPFLSILTRSCRPMCSHNWENGCFPNIEQADKATAGARMSEQTNEWANKQRGALLNHLTSLQFVVFINKAIVSCQVADTLRLTWGMRKGERDREGHFQAK